jgi:CheY-like chemotaxis protein
MTALAGEEPAVALAASRRLEDRARTRDAGYHVHVPRPVEPEELVSVIAGLGGGTAAA